MKNKGGVNKRLRTIEREQRLSNAWWPCAARGRLDVSVSAMQRRNGANNVDTLLSGCRLTPLVESFHVATWYVLRHYDAVVDAADLLLWRRLLEVPMSVTPHLGTSISFAEELELLLRIAFRIPKWLRVRRLEEQYGEYMHVGSALERLASLPGGDNPNPDEMLLRNLDGKAVGQLLSTAHVAAREVLQTAKISELRQLLAHQQERQHPFRQEILGAGGGVGRASLVPPSGKEELIDYILSIGCAESPFAAAWDAVIGPVCRVHQQFKTSLWRLSELFHVLTWTKNPHDVFSETKSVRHMSKPSVALLRLEQKLVSGPLICGVSAPLPPWWITRVAAGCSSPASAALSPFSSPEVLAVYMDALHLHQKLVELNEGSPWRNWNLALTMNYHKTIENGIDQLNRMEKLNIFSTTPTEGGLRKRTHSEEIEVGCERNDAFSLEALLQRGGLLYEHLLYFLPKYRWFMCAELLIALLQYNKHWDLANKWLRRLLEEPVYVITSVCGTVTFPFYYRFEKRGGWWHRLAQNLVHLGEEEAALNILEIQQNCWRQRLPADQHVKLEEFRTLPASIQRRVRLLYALFPQREAMGPECRYSLAQYNAIGEHHRLWFCQRSDRIAIECTLSHLHRTLRRWTPLPPSYSCFTRHLVKAKEVTIPALRDPEVSTLWRDPAQTMASCRVEEYVLRHFRTARRQDDGWVGLHCEGYWVACLARLLLWDAYCFDPDSGESGGSESALGPKFVWLSPLQESPLDLATSTISFVQRRRRIIEERLDFFEHCPRDILLDYVKERCLCGSDPRGSVSPVSDIQDGSKGESEVSLLSSEDDEKVQPGQPTARRDEEWGEKKTHPSSFSFFSPLLSTRQRVDVGDMPLLSLVGAIPQRPLCALLRCMYLSSPEEGYSIRFSGFPDLVLWREASSVLFEQSCFRLVEVKSPNDTLSGRQLVVLDMLHRCGFDTTVARVTDIQSVVKGKGRCGARRVRLDYTQEVVIVDDDNDEGASQVLN